MTEEILHTLQASDEDVRLRAVLEFGIPSTLEDIHYFITMFSDKSWRVRKAVVRVLVQADVATIVPLLVRSLSKGEAGIKHVRFNNAVIECLTEIGQPAIPALLTALHDADKDVRISAANALGAIRHHDACGALIEVLQDDHINVRYAAVEALAKIPSQQSVIPLTRILEDEEEWLKLPAISALGNIADARATPYLINIAQQPLYLQTAIEALGNIGDETGLPCVIDALSSSDKEIRKTAVVAMQHMVQKIEKMHAIMQRPTTYQSVFRAACTEQIMHNLIELLEDRDFNLVLAAIRLLGWSGRQEAAYALLEKLGNEHLIEPILSAITQIGETAIIPLTDAYTSSRSLERKLLILDCLHQIGGKHVLEHLLHYLQQSQEESLIYALLKALTLPSFISILTADKQTVSPTYYQPVLQQVETYLKSSHPLIRAEAVYLWGQLLGEAALEDILNATKDTDPTVRVKAIMHLGDFAKDHPELIQQLIILLSDDHPNIRKQAVLSLGRTANIDAFSSLLLVLNDSNAQVRRAAVSGLGVYLSQHAETQYHQHILEKLADVLENRCRRYEDGLLKIEICSTLHHIVSEQSKDLLLCLVEDVDFDVRKSALLALGTFTAFKSLLMPILLKHLQDAHWSVREAAVVALGELHCQEAEAALLDMLDDPDLAVRKALFITLARLQSEHAIPIFIEQLAHDELDYAAYRALTILTSTYRKDIANSYSGKNPKVNLLINHIIERNTAL